MKILKLIKKNSMIHIFSGLFVTRQDSARFSQVTFHYFFISSLSKVQCCNLFDVNATFL